MRLEVIKGLEQIQNNKKKGDKLKSRKRERPAASQDLSQFGFGDPCKATVKYLEDTVGIVPSDPTSGEMVEEISANVELKGCIESLSLHNDHETLDGKKICTATLLAANGAKILAEMNGSACGMLVQAKLLNNPLTLHGSMPIIGSYAHQEQVNLLPGFSRYINVSKMSF